MAVTTLGRQLVRRALPAKYKHYADDVLTAKKQKELMTAIAKEDPDGYIDVLQDMNAIGERVVSTYGKDTTITLDDLDSGAQIKNYRAKLNQLIRVTLNRKDLTPQQKQDKIIQLGYKYTAKMKDLGLQDANIRKTGLANQIVSGSRGNSVQLMQLIVGDMMMKDAMNRDIPFLATMPYVEGDSPLSYWASAMSGRKSTYDVQAATGRVGYLSKQATNTTHSTPISTQDCGTTDTGVPVKANDPQNIGSVLLYPWKGYKAGTPVNQDMIAQAGDQDEFIIRSPVTCKAHNGVCARCAGIQENGKFPAIGSYVALNSVKSFIEPLTQAGISCLEQNTPVRMADWSVKAIKDIKVGDMVLGCDKQGNARPVKVTHVFDNGMQQVYRTYFRPLGTKTQSKARITCLQSTLGHKILAATGKALKDRYFDQIEVGVNGQDFHALSLTSIECNGNKYHQPLAFLLGLLCGDGYYTKKVNRVYLSCADSILIEDLNTYLAPYDLKASYRDGNAYRISKLHTYKGDQQENLAKKLLKKYDMWGKYHYQKDFPNNYKQWDRQSISGFISGLWASDGHIAAYKSGNKINITLVSTSKNLIQQTSDMLYKFCGILPRFIKTYVPKTIPNGCKNRDNEKTMYILSISNVENVNSALQLIKPLGIKKYSRQAVLQKIGQQKNKKSRILNGFKRLNKEYLGLRHVFDIQVDHEDHLFLLQNGLIVSNSKHGSGMGGTKQVSEEGEDQPTGFDSVQRMLLAPKVFPGGAVLATVDGRVTEIRKAPQGGHYITVGSTTVYSPVARTVTAKVGDVVEAGDMLTNGVPNPMQIVKYKGIGQGRHYFTKKLAQILPKTGAGTLRRNLEQFSRAMINKVRITDPEGYGGYYPGDIADYDDIMDKWVPRDDSKETSLKDSVGRYLQKPVLYYSIGTRVTPSVIKKLQKYGTKNLITHQDPPPFEPQFVPSKQFVMQDKNWLPRLSGERLTTTIFDAARKGITDRYDSPSFVDKIIVEPYNPAK